MVTNTLPILLLSHRTHPHTHDTRIYSNDMTVMDELAQKFNKSGRPFIQLDKLQFPPVPHIQEPISLLTIEAYQTRVRANGRMNYYTGVMPKIAIWLSGNPRYTNKTTESLIKCCDFHNCNNHKFFGECRKLIPEQIKNLSIDGLPWVQPPHIHHYARRWLVLPWYLFFHLCRSPMFVFCTTKLLLTFYDLPPLHHCMYTLPCTQFGKIHA